jgi:hypothetical protein
VNRTLAASHFETVQAPVRPATLRVPKSPIGEALRSSSQPLDASLRASFEPRFGHDFSAVRVHTGIEAATSVKSFRAQAYAVGNDVVFGQNRYDPGSGPGRRLIAHELAHVAQQAQAQSPLDRSRIDIADAAQEQEAERISGAVLAGRQAPAPQRLARPALACFSDTSHHVIEEAALPGAGFDPEQIKAIERGNIHRDYSQLPAAANAALLGQAHGFGGYAPAEHFDNFIFDTDNNRWRTRGTGQNKFLHLDPKEPDPTPIDYISGQLSALAKAGMNEGSLEHLGNAFHTVEDFFAHSNFIELVHGDKRFGTDLLTGSFGDDPANSEASLAHTLGAVSTPSMRDYYDRRAEAATAKTEPASHSRLAKDTPEAAGFTEARRLAALVIANLAVDIRAVMSNKEPDARVQLMRDSVLAKIRRYLRPPDAKDPWWEGLTKQDAGAIDTRLAEAERRTPVTVNQAAFSPLRNMEASRDSTMAIPLGVAVPLGGSTFLQAGGGVTRPSPLDPRLPDTSHGPDERAGLFAGVQLTGHF